MTWKAIFLFIAILFACGAGELSSQTVYPLTGHPRLFFPASDEAVLKARLNATPVLN